MPDLIRKFSQIFQRKSDGDATADSIPRNILAFRTITRLLSIIQQDRGIQVSEPELIQGHQRRQLKIMNAFSTVAVMDQEIVAVVNNSNSGTFDLNSNKLDLIACVGSNDENPDSTPSTPPPLPLEYFLLPELSPRRLRRLNTRSI